MKKSLGVFFPLLLVAFIFGIVTFPATASSPIKVHLSKTVATTTSTSPITFTPTSTLFHNAENTTSPVTNNPNIAAELAADPQWAASGQWVVESNPINITTSGIYTVTAEIPSSDTIPVVPNPTASNPVVPDPITVMFTIDVGMLCFPNVTSITANPNGSHVALVKLSCSTNHDLNGTTVWVEG